MTTRSTGFAERQLEARLRWLIGGRLAISLLCLLAIRFIWPLGPAWGLADGTLLAAALLNPVYLLVLRARAPRRALAVIQILIDVVLVGLLVYLTGIDRFFTFLYFATIIAGAMVLGPRMAIAMASLASIMLASVFTLYFLSEHPDFRIKLPFLPIGPGAHLTRLDFLLPYLFFFALSLHVVALLAGRLSLEGSRVRILNEEILQNMAGGVVAADRFGGLQFVNPQAARLLGIADSEALRGRHLREGLPEGVAAVLQAAIESHERVAREVSVNGTPLSVEASCLSDGEGQALRGVVAILNDLTLRAEMEKLARRSERFQALLQMSAGMAHEIRNPLASIRGAAQELGSGSLGEEDERKLLRVVIRESDRLDRIIRDFLDYASDRPLELSLCDVADLVRETVDLLEAREDARGVEILRETPGAVTARATPDRLKQVLLNLGLNAIEACAARNGRPPRVTLRCASRSGFQGDPRPGVLIEVEDNGCGVPAAGQARLFDPFFTTKSHGTGMGLAIARRIVQAHGGEIALQSVEGKGTVARVWLPA